MKSKTIIIMLTSLTLAACGNGGSGGGSSTGPQQSQHESIEASDGTYYTVLRPINFHSNGYIPYGAATFTLKENQLQVNVSMDDDQSITHRQTLHMGTRCPTASDDTNGDTFIDYNESLAVVGDALMPLDGDLNSKAAGSDIYPRGPAMSYNRSASLSNINSELTQSSGKNLALEGKVVLVHGTAPDSSFPTSLASLDGEPAHLSLPVVCGVLRKID